MCINLFNIISQAKAVQHYEQAADYFKGEESVSSANKCMLKVAQYAAQLEDYEKAINIYEQVGSSEFVCIKFFNFIIWQYLFCCLGGSFIAGKFTAQI